MATDDKRVREILAIVKPLAAEYYQLTGKPLGVTGEVAEYVAAELLGLHLVEARTSGHDAIRETSDGPVRIQIKGRACSGRIKPGQRLGRIKHDAACDSVMLVLLDNVTLEAREIWEAPYAAVTARLLVPGSRSRNERGALSVHDFKKLAGTKQVWPNGTGVEHG